MNGPSDDQTQDTPGSPHARPPHSPRDAGPPRDERARAIFLELGTLSGPALDVQLAHLAAQDPDVHGVVKAMLEAHKAAADAGFMASPTTASSLVPLSEKPGTRIGPYKLLQVIGEGGFGTVFLAEQLEPVRRRVALKIIKLGMDSKSVVARFEAERQALALMNHPHIARVFDGGMTDSGRPYFVMEYVVGDAITLFADAHKLDMSQRLGLFEQVCRALQHAHQKGVIHRDIKPANVLTSMVDGKPFAKVIDFGIAKATAAPLTEKTLFTEHRQLIGTPEYMSPEQAEGSPDIDTRADVYALGVLLYELLTGLTPLDGKRLRSAQWNEMVRIIREEEPPAPSVRVARSLETQVRAAENRRVEPARLSTLVKGELDWIVMKSLEKERARRYDTPNALADDLLRHVSGEPVVAAPPSTAYRVRKFVRRHKARVIAAGAVVSVLVVGLATTTWQWRRADSALVTASKAQQAEREQREQAEFSAYTAGLALAQSSMESGNFKEARKRLANCPERLRGWEWGHLNQKAHSATIYLPGQIAQFHTGTQQIVTASGPLLSRWDVLGNAVQEPIRLSGVIEDIQMSTDVNVLLIGCQGEAHILTPNGERLCPPVFVCPGDTAWRDWLIHLHSDGNSFVSENWRDGTAQIWSTTGEPLGAPIESGSGINFQPQPLHNHYILYGSGGPRIVQIGRGVVAQIRRDDWGLYSSGFGTVRTGKGGTRIITQTLANSLQIWDLQGRPTGAIRTDTAFSTWDVDPTGQRIATVFYDGSIQTWTIDGVPLGTHSEESDLLPFNSLSYLSFDQSGRRIAAFGGKNTNVLISEDAGRHWRILNVHKSIYDIAFTPDGSRLVVVSNDRTLSVWATTGEFIGSLSLLNNAQDILAVCDSPAGLQAVIQCYSNYDEYGDYIDSGILIVPLEKATELLLWDLTGDHADLVLDAAIDRISSVRAAELAEVASLQNDDVVVTAAGGETFRLNADGDTRSFAITPDAQRIITAGSENAVRVWDASSGRQLARLPVPFPATALEFSASGSQLIVRLADGSVQVWNTSNGEPSASLSDRLALEQAAASEYVATLLRSDVATADLRASVDRDSSLPARRRLACLRLLAHEVERIQVQASSHYVKVMDHWACQQDVLDCLTYGTGSKRIRAEALKLYESTTRSEHSIDQLLFGPDLSDSQYSCVIALLMERQAEKPEKECLYSTKLGIAQYRIGLYEQASRSFEHSIAMGLTTGSAGTWAGTTKWEIERWGFLALSRLHLGLREGSHSADAARDMFHHLNEPFYQAERSLRDLIVEVETAFTSADAIAESATTSDAAPQ